MTDVSVVAIDIHLSRARQLPPLFVTSPSVLVWILALSTPLALVLYNAIAKTGPREDDYPWGWTRDSAESWRERSTERREATVAAH